MQLQPGLFLLLFCASTIRIHKKSLKKDTQCMYAVYKYQIHSSRCQPQILGSLALKVYFEHTLSYFHHSKLSIIAVKFLIPPTLGKLLVLLYIFPHFYINMFVIYIYSAATSECVCRVIWWLLIWLESNKLCCTRLSELFPRYVL